MTRQLVLVAILGLAAAPLAAEQPTVPQDAAHSFGPSLMLPDDEAASENEDPEGPAASVAANLSPDVMYSPAADSLAAPYLGSAPASDCGCCVPCLDCDLLCGVPRGRTHAWPCDVGCCNTGGLSDGIVRLGGWGVATEGSRNRTGEFQDLSSSPFWDVDMIRSDGVRTWDMWLSGLDNEANDGRVRYYGPGLTADVQFQRFLRRWDHDPLTGLDLAPGDVPPPGPEGNVISEDLNVGEDYAIRVQELDAQFRGRLANNVNWRMNVWGLRKFGERQTNSTGHCFNVNAPAAPGATGNVCHVLSERQMIDWVTLEVQPGIEARFDNVVVDYTTTIRAFGQDDQMVDRQYTRFGFSPASGVLGDPFAHALVPESFTHIHRLSVNAQLTENNQLYASGYLGDTENQFRDTHRQFGGYDVRLVNTSLHRTTLTTYASMHDENNELPETFLTDPPFAPAGIEPGALRHPVDYNRVRAGAKASWSPFGNTYTFGSAYGGWSGLSLVAGYEYYLVARDYATYESRLGPFTQPDTKRHQLEFGPSMKWSPELDTRLRYKVRFIEDPLIGVREASGDLNTNQPEFENEVEVGATWMPATNFMANATVGLIHRRHDSVIDTEEIYFRENDFPVTLTAWFAPTSRLSLSGGYAYFSNYIDQDITLGHTTPAVPVPPFRTETTRWDYTGDNHLISFAATYCWTPNVRLLGGYEWNRGRNFFDNPPSPAGADWSLLPVLSDVIVETTRLTVGMDWEPRRNTTAYVRYVYFDWDDISAGLDTGTAHMALVGAGVTW